MDKSTERLIQLIKQAQAEYGENHLIVGVPGFLSKKFIAYCAMNADLALILEYIQLLKEKPNKIISSSLAYSLIALYGKCFTDASKNSYPKLEPGSLFVGEDAHLEAHNFMMELRHQFIAHRGKTEKEVGISFMIVPKNGDFEQTQLRFSQLKMITFSDEELDKVEVLVRFLIVKLEELIQVKGQKVHDALLKLFTPEQLVQMMINNAK